MFLKAKRGEKIDRIVHIDVVNERTQNINNKINEINEINRTIYAKNKMAQAKNKTICAKNNSKFVAKQFNMPTTLPNKTEMTVEVIGKGGDVVGVAEVSVSHR
jgi:hypothetical protein